MRRLSPSYSPKAAKIDHSEAYVRTRVAVSRHFRNVAIVSSLLITTTVALYVSIPDFPYHAKSWELWLWSEPSGWWSEITWIIAFGAFSSCALLFRSWFLRLRPTKGLMLRARLGACLTLVSWGAVTVGYLLYFRPMWPGLGAFVLLDPGGTLHGLFYIATAHLGAIALVFALALVGRSVAIISARV